MTNNDPRLSDIQAILSNNLMLDAHEYDLDSRLADDLGLDSLDEIELIMAIEEKYDIDIEDEELYEPADTASKSGCDIGGSFKLITIQDILDLLNKQLGPAKTADQNPHD